MKADGEASGGVLEAGWPSWPRIVSISNREWQWQTAHALSKPMVACTTWGTCIYMAYTYLVITSLVWVRVGVRTDVGHAPAGSEGFVGHQRPARHSMPSASRIPSGGAHACAKHEGWGASAGKRTAQRSTAQHSRSQSHPPRHVAIQQLALRPEHGRHLVLQQLRVRMSEGVGWLPVGE